MQQFLRRCDDAGARCTFGGHAAAKFDQLLARARQAPIIVSTPDGPLPVSYPDLVGLTLASLYEPDTWADLGDTLQALYDAGVSGSARRRPGPVPALLARTAPPGIAPQGYDNQFEALLGVACTDGVEPRKPSGWARAAARADQRYGPFGSPWAWLSEACATWPATDPDRYRGPFTARPAALVLLVGTRFDPALAYSNATLVDRELPNNRLLTLNGWGHVALDRSTCIQQRVAAYLITVRLPPVGATCPPDRRPFEPAGAREGAVRHG